MANTCNRWGSRDIKQRVTLHGLKEYTATFDVEGDVQDMTTSQLSALFWENAQEVGRDLDTLSMEIEMVVR